MDDMLLLLDENAHDCFLACGFVGLELGIAPSLVEILRCEGSKWPHTNGRYISSCQNL